MAMYDAWAAYDGVASGYVFKEKLTAEVAQCIWDNLEPRGVAVAVDGEVVPRRTWGEATFDGGEHVEILSIAQGG